MEKYLNIINNHFAKSKTIKLFTNQLEKISSYNEENNHTYNYGDIVKIDENYLIHGTRIQVEELKKIKETGLIAPEFFKEVNEKKKKPWVVEFWNVEHKMTLKEYLDKRCGVTIDFINFDGSVKKSVMCPLNEIEVKVIQEQDFRDFIIYQNQEQRFLPNKYHKNEATMAFIVKNDSKQKEEIIKNDIFSKEFDREILEEILPIWFIEKYFEGTFDHHETGREKAIIIGIPSSFIEGIIVNREIEHNKTQLKAIKEIFNNCYICNIDGKVIM